MTKLCERPGCSEPGAAAYGMRPEDLLFWVDHLDTRADQEGRVLCRRHADAMVVPRGWTLDDRREPMPRLFRPPGGNRAPSTRGATRPAPRRPMPADVPRVEQLALDEYPPTDGADTAPPPDEPVTAAPIAPPTAWNPSFDHDDDLDGLLEVRSPLLARAFRGADRPRR